jgi:hypothetical protein
MSKKDNPKKCKVFLLTLEELERIDQMMTAMTQAYWALVTQRAVKVPTIDSTIKITPEEEKFYQLHLELNDEIDTHEF